MKPQERYVEHLQAAVEAAADGELDRSARALKEIAAELPMVTSKRRSISTRRRAQIYSRDCFTCVYCGTRTIPECVLRVLSAKPELASFFPWDESWRAAWIHPAYPTITTSLDHLKSGSRLGEWLDDDDNLVTACALCNYTKSEYLLEELGWKEPNRRQSEWDGLTTVYPKLWAAMGEPDPKNYHRGWITAFASVSRTKTVP
jgi:5-methylcytosine-specific restriction endonuclease McrA